MDEENNMSNEKNAIAGLMTDLKAERDECSDVNSEQLSELQAMLDTEREHRLELETKLAESLAYVADLKRTNHVLKGRCERLDQGCPTALTDNYKEWLRDLRSAGVTRYKDENVEVDLAELSRGIERR